MVIDCLRFNFHPSHYNLDQALKISKILNPEKTILTNLNTDIDYNSLKEYLPRNTYLAYDGMVLNL